MSNLHVTLINVLLVFVGLHVAAVIAYRLVKGQDLVVPMVVGTKAIPASHARAPRHAHPGLGLLLAAGAGLLVWWVTRLG